MFKKCLLIDSHSFSDEDFPDGSVTGAQNFCRNPNGMDKPWCYTTDPNVDKEFCQISICQGTIVICVKLQVNVTQHSLVYRGFICVLISSIRLQGFSRRKELLWRYI